MKFSIRDLLLVTVIVALAVGWGLDHLATRSECQRLEREIASSQDRERLAVLHEEVRSRSLDGAIPDWRRRVAEFNQVHRDR